LNYILSRDNIKLNGIELIENLPKSELKQYEAVISPRFPGIGKSITEFNFYEHYQAVVLAIHRNGERITTNLGNLKLREGDNLILLTTEKFIQSWGDSKIFYLTSYIRDYRTTGSFWKKWLAFIILLTMISGATLGQFFESPKGLSLDMFFFAAIAAVLMVWFKILPHQKYTKSISWDVLITIAFSFALSKALQNSGAADAIANATINIGKGMGPIGVLAAVFLITTIFTEIITNNAAAAIVFPIALSAANQLGVDPKPFFCGYCNCCLSKFLHTNWISDKSSCTINWQLPLQRLSEDWITVKSDCLSDFNFVDSVILGFLIICQHFPRNALSETVVKEKIYLYPL
jgi:di/tricarboxylate transporter